LEIRLDREDKPLFDRLADLTLGKDRIPDPLTKETAERAVSWVAQCRHAIGDLTKAHKRNKGPVLALGRWFDARYLHRGKDFDLKIVNPIEARIRRYRQALADAQHAREVEQRRIAAQQAEEAAAAARNRQQEAQLAEQAGNRRAAVDLTRQAAAALEEAEKQERLANMPDQPVHIAGEHGATAFGVKRWHFYVSDTEALPDQYWMPDEIAIKEYMNAALARGETPTLPGVTFSQEEETRIRRC
jgi:hypothetical protein